MCSPYGGFPYGNRNRYPYVDKKKSFYRYKVKFLFGKKKINLLMEIIRKFPYGDKTKSLYGDNRKVSLWRQKKITLWR